MDYEILKPYACKGMGKCELHDLQDYQFLAFNLLLKLLSHSKSLKNVKNRKEKNNLSGVESTTLFH